MCQNIFKEPGGCLKTFLKNLANVSKHWLVRNWKRYHSDPIVDQRLSKDHVVKVWVDSDLRQRKGQQVTWSCQFHQPTCSSGLGTLSRDLVVRFPNCHEVGWETCIVTWLPRRRWRARQRGRRPRWCWWMWKPGYGEKKNLDAVYVCSVHSTSTGFKALSDTYWTVPLTVSWERKDESKEPHFVPGTLLKEITSDQLWFHLPHKSHLGDGQEQPANGKEVEGGSLRSESDIQRWKTDQDIMMFRFRQK